MQNQKESSKQKPKMTLLERVSLSPIEKYMKFDLFPNKLVFHLLLIVFTSIQIMILTSDKLRYTRGMYNYIYQIFYPSDISNYNDPGFIPVNYFDSYDDLITFVNNSVITYFSLDSSISFQNLQTSKDQNSQKPINPMLMLYPRQTLLTNEMQTIYNLSTEDLGIFNLGVSDLKNILDFCAVIHFNYQIYSVIKGPNNTVIDSIKWDIIQIINFEDYSYPEISLTIVPDTWYLGEKNANYHSEIIVQLCVLVCAAFSFLLLYNYFFEFIYTHLKLKKLLSKQKVKISSLDIANETIESNNSKEYGDIDKFLAKNDKKVNSLNEEKENKNLSKQEREKKIRKSIAKSPHTSINYWNVLCAFGNILQIMGATLYLISQGENLNIIAYFQGFGAFFAWVNIVKYFQYDSQYFYVFSSLFISFPVVVRYLIGIMPIFIGYGLIGATVFWQSFRFRDLKSAFYSQFALLNGDMIFDTYNDLSTKDPFFAPIYLYSYVLLFICVVQNLFVSIFQNYFGKVQNDHQKTKEKEKIQKLISNSKNMKDKVSKEITNIISLKQNKLMKLLYKIKAVEIETKGKLSPEDENIFRSEYQSKMKNIFDYVNNK